MLYFGVGMGCYFTYIISCYSELQFCLNQEKKEERNQDHTIEKSWKPKKKFLKMYLKPKRKKYMGAYRETMTKS